MAGEMKDKICLVTGGTEGIGKAVSAGLAARGAYVIMVALDQAKGEAALKDIKTAGSGGAEFISCDLLSQAAIRGLAKDLSGRLGRLDVLFNNAGGAFSKRQLTADNVERSLALNLLAPFLLTNLLLPLLEKSAPARIVNTATLPRPGDLVDLENLQSERNYSAFGAYGRAKTGLITFTYELSRRLQGKRITANSFHPGVVTETGFTRDLPKAMQLLGPLFAGLLRMRVKLEDAGEAGVRLASAPDLEGVTGKYFHKGSPVTSLPQTYELEFATRLWNACSSLTGLGA